MNLPNMKEARKRTDKEVEHIFLHQQYNKNFQGQKYFLKTYGCQMNVHDGEEIASRLETLGFEATDKIETADIITFISDIFIEKLKGSDTTKQVSPYIKSFE